MRNKLEQEQYRDWSGVCGDVKEIGLYLQMVIERHCTNLIRDQHAFAKVVWRTDGRRAWKGKV